jgi:hypothetical protein
MYAISWVVAWQSFLAPPIQRPARRTSTTSTSV